MTPLDTAMKALIAPLTLCMSLSCAAASSCDQLKDQITANIKSHGVQDFTVSIVDAKAPASGKVVGSCELGSKKLVYARTIPVAGTTAQPAVAAQFAAKPAPVSAPSGISPGAAPRTGPTSKPPRIITECRDGTVPSSGSCQ